MNQITLTVAEILDLARAANIVGNKHKPQVDAEELETEYTIWESKEGTLILDDDKTEKRYRHGAYISEYPDEGTFPLGNPLDAERTVG